MTTPAENKLREKIERSFHNLLTNEVKEHLVDFVVLYVQRNKMPVDRDAMTQILEVVRIAIDDAFHQNIDRCMDGLAPALEEFVSDANPLAGGAKKNS